MCNPRALTPTQRAILAVLADGRPHSREEIHACLPDDLGALSNAKAHLTAIRKRLRPMGQDVVCQLVDGRYCYRLVHYFEPIISGTGQIPGL